MTRDEAIGRIKARFDKWALDDEDMKAIQTLIPELRESEDERIRKRLLWFLANYTGKWDYPETRMACRAWLEKQKENIEKEYVFRPLAGTDITIAAKQAIRKADEGDRLVLAFNGAYIPVRKGSNVNKIVDIYDAFIEKQKECLADNNKTSTDEDERIRKEINILYSDIDACITELLKARTDKDSESEGKALFKMEGLMVATLQDLSCIEDYLEKQKEQKPAEWSEDTIRKAVKEVGLTQHQIDWFKTNVLPPKQEWSEEDEEMLDIVLTMVDCSTVVPHSGGQLHPSESYKKDISDWLKSLRPQYHGDVTMTEAYKMGLEAGKASSWKPSEEQTNNVIVELTRIELGDIINGLYYLKEKYYEDCKEHNGTATMGLSDEFKFYFKRFNEVLDLYTRLHKLEKEKYGTTTDGYYYE